jgi:hypothetical protein
MIMIKELKLVRYLYLYIIFIFIFDIDINFENLSNNLVVLNKIILFYDGLY